MRFDAPFFFKLFLSLLTYSEKKWTLFRAQLNLLRKEKATPKYN
jgi:hypothetical protein